MKWWPTFSLGCLSLGSLPRTRTATHYQDATAGSEEETSTPHKALSAAKKTPRKKKIVDEDTKRTLISNLRSIILSIEKHMVFADGDLEGQLVSRFAVSLFLHRFLFEIERERAKLTSLTKKMMQEESDYHVERAASEFIERAGLRQIEMNSTLRHIEPEDDNPSVVNAWSYCEPTVFRIRCGPNYKQTKLKAQAKAPALYSLIGVDVYTSEQKVEHLSRFMKLRELEDLGANMPLPELFIINFMLPLEEPKIPSLFGPQPVADGPTVCFHYVMRISQWTKENLDHPSVELFARFLRNCGDAGSMRERLKIIYQVANPDELNLNRVERGIYKKYNGLPFLYRQYNSSFRRGAGWFQADFDGHRSGFATRMSR